MYMGAMLGISLNSYPYLKLAKMLCIPYYLLFFQQNWRRGQNLEAGEGVAGFGGCEGEVAQCTHM
jgi:hypothetical protein